MVYFIKCENILTESPNGTHDHVFTNMRSWGKLFVSCWPVYQSDEQRSPFTSNFTSDVTQALVKKGGKKREGEREKFGENECKSLRKNEHLRPLVMCFS